MRLTKGRTNLFAAVLSVSVMGAFAGCNNGIPTSKPEATKSGTPKAASQNTPDELAMLTATQTNDLTAIKELLGKGVGVNMRGPDRNTPIMEAAYAGHIETVKFLLDHGADLSAVKNDGATVVGLAGGQMDVSALFENVIRLVEAAGKGENERLQALIDSGTSVNGLDQNGSSALAEASWHGRTDTVKLLLDNGADPTITKADGASPLTLATGQKHQDIVDVLNAAIEKRSKAAPTAGGK